MPRATRPAATWRTRASVCAQVTDSQSAPRGNRNASAAGVRATRSTNRWATERARCSIRERSMCSSPADMAMVAPDGGPTQTRMMSAPGTSVKPHKWACWTGPCQILRPAGSGRDAGGEHRPAALDVVGYLHQQALYGVELLRRPQSFDEL